MRRRDKEEDKKRLIDEKNYNFRFKKVANANIVQVIIILLGQ